MSRRGRQFSRSLIHDLHEAESKIRASVAGQVRPLSQEEIEAIAATLTAPREQRDDYRGYDYV